MKTWDFAKFSVFALKNIFNTDTDLFSTKICLTEKKPVFSQRCPDNRDGELA